MNQRSTSRRQFLSRSGKATLALTVAGAIPSVLSASNSSGYAQFVPADFKTGYDQAPLPYGYSALEPVIDAMTMELHYSKHAATYSKNLKEAAVAENIDTKKSLEDVLASVSTYSAKIRNNGGGHYNHELFWKLMKPGTTGKPSAKLMAAIEKDFNSFEAFKTQFSDAGKNRFGSGWAWLVAGPDNKLLIGSTPNQDNPLMDVSELKGFPLLGLDVWEHAYYLKYQNRRPEYIENWWKVVNWQFVSDRFEASNKA
jgi:Fe-Mn family superoxide dismutase